MKLLKIGGSVITDKTKPYTPLYDVINGIAVAVSDVYVSGIRNFIIGHGGGSFPHVSAKKYEVVRGIVDEKTRCGAGIVHRDATEINQIFVRALHEHGVPAFSFHPSSFIYLEDGVVKKVFVEPIIAIMGKGLVPVIYGDVVVDGVRGVVVFSTEKVFEVLVEELAVDVIGMAERFGGVYTTDPSSNPSAELIERVDKHNFEEVMKFVSGSHGVDVTGGMKHKLEMLIELAKRGIDSVIFKGTPENVRRFLMGDEVKGTYITW